MQTSYFLGEGRRNPNSNFTAHWAPDLVKLFQRTAGLGVILISRYRKGPFWSQQKWEGQADGFVASFSCVSENISAQTGL